MRLEVGVGDLVGLVGGLLFGSVAAIATVRAHRAGHVLAGLLADATNDPLEDVGREPARRSTPHRTKDRPEGAGTELARPSTSNRRRCARRSKTGPTTLRELKTGTPVDRSQGRTREVSVDACKPQIVVGVTDDPAARSALRWAFDVATLNDALLVVVTAYSFPRAVVAMEGVAYFDIHDAEDAARSGQTRLIESELRVALPNRQIHQVVAYGDAVTALIAESSDADLLVVGRRPRRLRRLFRRSVSKGCAKRAACPVVITRSERQEAKTLRPLIGAPIGTVPNVPNLNGDRGHACHQAGRSRIEAHRHKH
jgi:nucleotide-binding universal stress UspA family protein